MKILGKIDKRRLGKGDGIAYELEGHDDKRIFSDTFWASLYSDEVSDTVAIYLFLKDLNDITYPLDRWVSTDDFLFWVPVLKWAETYKGLKLFISPVPGEPDLSWRQTPMGKLFKEVAPDLKGQVAEPTNPAIFRPRLQLLEMQKKINWGYSQSEARIYELIGRKLYSNFELRAFAQGVCCVPKVFQFGTSRAYWG